MVFISARVVERGKLSRNDRSSKIVCHCTAQLSATVDNSTGEVVVKSWLTHYGHSRDLAHLCLTNNGRHRVATRVKDGITFDRIIDDIRSNISSRVDCVHLIAKKDVSNIQQSFLAYKMWRGILMMPPALQS